MKSLRLLMLTVFILASCTTLPTPEPTATAVVPYRITPDENPFAPGLADVNWQIATVTIVSVGLSEQYEFSPPRAMLSLVGYMPSVCNELQVSINPPDEDFNLYVDVYSLINPDVQCDNVFQQFETSILLGTYSPGRYAVWVNDVLMGDFVSY